MNKFRLNAAKLSLTYPQCSMTKDSMLESLKDKFKDNLKEYLIVQELHEDGNLHLHCYVELKKKIDYGSPLCLDFKGFHGNYQSCKSKENWIQYLLKADKEYLGSQDWKIWLSNSKSHLQRQKNIDQLELIEKKGLAKCVRDGDINIARLPIFEKALNIMKTLELKDDRLELEDRLETPWNFNLNFDLDLKKCHFWIYSKKSNYGKTTFATQLITKYLGQTWNMEEKYQPQITQNTQLIIMDEYSKKNCLTIGLLNQIMDGTVYITGKGLNAWKLNQKPLVIIFSNFGPMEIYTNTPNLPNLMSRITVINLEDNHNGF